MRPSPEIWVLVFKQLLGDYDTLRNVSLVSHAWRTLSWPCLLELVDVSSHNIERRLTEHEIENVMPIVYSHHHAKFRPPNLVSRQRGFLRLISKQPSLATHVKSFTWTLVWTDTWDDSHPAKMQDIDLETWNVFAQLVNVTQLDLASIHDSYEEEILYKNPTRLFPRVTNLRLLGWMHRNLVRAIVSTIDAAKLYSLRLDYLEDQGSLPSGHPMSAELAMDFAHTARHASISDEQSIIDDKLFLLQETGKAAVFPGPMWFPLRLLSDRSLNSLSHIQISLSQFDMDIDLRNYYSTFRYTAELLRKSACTLESIAVIFVEDSKHYGFPAQYCGTGRINFRTTWAPWAIKMAATFLKHLTRVLSENRYPLLKCLSFKGFHLLETKIAGADFGGVLPYLRSCPFRDIDFTGTPFVNGGSSFVGLDCAVPEYDEVILRNS